jgi:hypothetical protein
MKNNADDLMMPIIPYSISIRLPTIDSKKQNIIPDTLLQRRKINISQKEKYLVECLSIN